MANPRPLEKVTVVFDLDGTLVDTAPDLLSALNHTLEKFDFVSVPAEAAYSLIGHGAKAMIRAGLLHQEAEIDEFQIEVMFDVFLEHYIQNIAVASRPFPGCVAALERLAAAGAKLAVCTNKRQNLAEALLEALDLSQHFAAIVGADSVPSPKPDGGHIRETLSRAGHKAGTAIMIGDSETDEKAARDAELPFVFVPMGYGPISDQTRLQGCVLNHYDDLSVARVAKLLAL